MEMHEIRTRLKQEVYEMSAHPELYTCGKTRATYEEMKRKLKDIGSDECAVCGEGINGKHTLYGWTCGGTCALEYY